jgi:putative FmdB family regulatory protein
VPLYEYICETDGSTLELLRPMADADKPVEDPDGKGRVFKRKHSTFATAGAAASGAGSSLLNKNTCCPCGKTGGCGSAN